MTTVSSSPPSLPSPDSIRDAVIRLAGDSQDGIQALGGFLARLAGRSSQKVVTYMTIPATISGGPSIFQLRIDSREAFSPGDEVDFLVAFHQHSYDAHRASLKAGGVLLYDSDAVQPNPADPHTAVPVPLTTLTAETLGGPKEKGKNMVVLGVLAVIFQFDIEKLHTLVRERFGKKDPRVAQTALKAFDAGYTYPLEKVFTQRYRFEPAPAGKREEITMDGNQALAYGLLAAGVRYGAAYPITPSTSVMEILRAELPKYGGLFLQTEDELAAVAAAIGFSYGGHLAVTTTSGPGLSLKGEAIGWATMAEMPLLVVDVQRGGPSTGLPTQTEQSDLSQAIFGGHGDSPRVVLAARNVEDCFYIVQEAARIALQYSTPVLILSDAALATRIEAFEEPELEKLFQAPKPDFTPRPAEFKPYPLEARTQHAPPGAPMLSGKYPVLTGLEHDESGHPSAAPAFHAKMTAKRREKLKALARELPLPEVYGDAEGTLLVGWGSTWGVIREAVERLRGEGKFAAVHLRHLHPLPESGEGLAPIFARYEKIIVIETNDAGLYGHGQLATLLRARYCEPKISSLNKTTGLSFLVQEVIAGVKEKL